MKKDFSKTHSETFQTSNMELYKAHIKIKKPYAHFSIKIFLIENECKTPLNSFSIKNIFKDKMGLRFFYFDVATLGV